MSEQDKTTQELIEEWVADGNEITREELPETVFEKATREGVHDQTADHEHRWEPMGSGKYKCERCGAKGFVRKRQYATLQQPGTNGVVEYTCYVPRCKGWAITRNDSFRWVCPEHMH